MYLFGFPEGLAGGSKETEYNTFFNTSHDTSKSTAIGNTSWATNKTTSRTTQYPIYNYTSALGLFLYHTDLHYISLYNHYNSAGILFKWRYCPQVTSGGTPYHFSGSIGTARVSWLNQKSGWSWPGNGNPEDNVGKVKDNFVFGSYVEMKSDKWWMYQLKITPGQSHLYWKAAFNPLIPPTTTYTNKNTSWGTYLRNTSAPTYRSTIAPTTYQTNQLTTRITYG